MAKLLSKTDSFKPLFLVVAWYVSSISLSRFEYSCLGSSEELRVFGVYEKVSERINSMASTVPALFEEVLKRLEGDNDRELFIAFVTLLTCSRAGLLEVEMLRLLGHFVAERYNGQNSGVSSAKSSSSSKLLASITSDPLPQSAWASLYRSLKSYLRPPGESGICSRLFLYQRIRTD
jgi:nephrocystin-3